MTKDSPLFQYTWFIWEALVQWEKGETLLSSKPIAQASIAILGQKSKNTCFPQKEHFHKQATRGPPAIEEKSHIRREGNAAKAWIAQLPMFFSQ